MKVIDLKEKLGLEVFSGQNGLGKEVSGGYVSDLLSDVMGNATENEVWVTVQIHSNIVAVASLKELSAIILVKGLKPEANTIERSNSENIPVLGSGLSAFELTGRIYELLKEGK
jgi:predicted transcriptional regulator